MPRIILLSILLLLLFFLCSCTVGIEKQKYTVLEKEDKFEIRQYPAHLIAETIVETDFNDAANVAFGRLFKYISGNNKTKEAISMTAPVNQTASSEKISMTVPVNQQQSGEKYSVSFVMPSKYSLQSLPEPLDPTVTVKEIPAFKAAAIRYSGTWSKKRYESKRASLEEFLKRKELVPKEQPVFARYNAPFELWFLRRNEVIIPVK
ncbi:MAG: heme-binding protein [Sedimentisphaerales bacterium]|nr:heme-binding protein [Sedimentisphaerales bacterium]